MWKILSLAVSFLLLKCPDVGAITTPVGANEGKCGCAIKAISVAYEDPGYDKEQTKNNSYIYVNGQRVTEFQKVPASASWWRGLNLLILRWQDKGCYINSSIIFDLWTSLSAAQRLKQVLTEALPGDILVGVANDEASRYLRMVTEELSAHGIFVQPEICGNQFYRSAFAFIARVGSPERSQFTQVLRGLGPVTLESSLCPVKSKGSSTLKGDNVEVKKIALQGGRTDSEGLVNAIGPDDSVWLIREPPSYQRTMGDALAKVICTELGFTAGRNHRIVPAPYFQPDTFSQRLLEVRCLGNESAMSDCPTVSRLSTNNTATCFRALGVRCDVPLSDKYPFGYPALGRGEVDNWENAIYISHPGDKLPHEGYVTSWHFFPLQPGTIYFQVWRKLTPKKALSWWQSGSHLFFLVKQTKVVVNKTDINKQQTVTLTGDERIPFREDDDLGFYFPGKAMIPFSVVTAYCSESDKVLYSQQPEEIYPQVQLYFRQKHSSWNPCRMYSVYATIQNTTIPEEDHVTLPAPTTTPRPTPPANLKVQLVNGRTENEGLIKVSGSSSDRSGYVCDSAWGQNEANVVCRQLGYAGGIPKRAPFFGRLSYSDPRLLQVRCAGNETSLTECRALQRWGSSRMCPYSQGAGVECIPRDYGTDHDSANRTRVFGYPAISRSETDSMTNSVIILTSFGEFPQSGSVISGFSLFLKPTYTRTKPVSRDLYIQVWRYHHENEQAGKQMHADYMLVNQTFLNTNSSTGVVEFKVDPPMVARSGDLLGVYFPGVNRIPYDYGSRCPSAPSNKLYIQGVTGAMTPGGVYTFHSLSYSPCYYYSLFAKYHLQDVEVKSSFSYNEHDYAVVTDMRLAQNDASAFCSQKLGTNWTLVEIGSEDEMNSINDALNTIHFNTTVEYWIGTRSRDPTNSDKLIYSRWGFCQPEAGLSCVVLSNNHHGSGDYSGLDFYMYSRNCFREQKFFICEYSPTGDIPQPRTTSAGKSTTIGPEKGNSTSGVTPDKKPQKAPGGMAGSTIAGIVIGIILIAGALLLALLFIIRRRRQKYGASMFRFNLLDNNSAR